MAATTQRRRRGRIRRDQRLGVAYVRYSDQKQQSIPEQIATCEEIGDDLRIKIVEIFQDPAVSRSVKDRPGLLAMFQYLKDHPEVGFIIVPELERLTAGVAQRTEVTRLCQEADIHIATEDLEDPIDPYDADAMQKADENAVAANREVLKIRRRVKRTLKQKAISGTVLMRPPYGVRMKPVLGVDGTALPAGTRLVDARGRTVRSGEIEIHPDELPWLRKIFEWAAEGKSCLEIRRALQAEGVKTKTGRNDWANRTITGIIENRFYIGEMTWGLRETVRLHDGTKFAEHRLDDDPAIIRTQSPLGALIPPDLWHKANEGMRKTAGKRTVEKRRFPSQLFDHLVFCDLCGNKMYGRSDGNLPFPPPPGRTFQWRYCCFGTTGKHRPNAIVQPGHPGGCDKPWTYSEKKILGALASLGSEQARVRPRVTTKVDVGAERRRIERELADKRARRSRVTANYEDGDISREEKVAKHAAIDAEITTLTRQLKELEDGTTGSAPLLVPTDPKAWPRFIELLADREIPVEVRREALVDRAGIERIYVDGYFVTVQLRSGDPGREQGLLRLQEADRLPHAS